MGNRRGNQISLTRPTTKPPQPAPQETTPDPQSPETAVPQTAVPQPAVSQPAPVHSEEPEVLRTTMFFTAEMLDRMDAAKRTLTKLTGIRGRAVSRTKIVEMAMEVMLADLENRQEASSLVAQLRARQ